MSTEVNQDQDFFDKYRGWIVLLIGIFTGLLLAILTRNWQSMFIVAILTGGFSPTSYKKGMKYGSFSVLFTYFILLGYLYTTSPLMDVMNVFIGIIGLNGMGYIIFIVTLLIGFLIGLTGGYFGSVWSSLINWDEWVWW